MNVRLIRILLLLLAATLVAALWMVVARSADGNAAGAGGASVPAAGDPFAAPGGAAAPEDDAVPPLQFLRNQARATVIDAAVDHRPMARGSVVRLAVEVEMLPGMHVNANPASQDWMIPIEASVTGVEGIGVIDAFYPEAQSRTFPYDDDPYLVYEGTFVIGLVLAVAEQVPPSGPVLEIVVDYQACNDEACFAPAQATFELPLLIAAAADDAVRVAPPIFERAPFPR